MKKVPLFLLILCLVAILSSHTRAESLNQYRFPGQKGIILAWNGSWDIGNGTFEGGIGYKHWISNRVALRGFFTLAKTDESIVNEDDGYPPEYRLRENTFSILTGMEDHFWNRGRLSFLLGGGLLFKTSFSKTDYVVNDPQPDEIKGVRSKQNTFGIQSILGVEYFFTKNLSLSGQYQIDFSLDKISDKYIYWGEPAESQPQKQKVTNWNLGISTSLLIMTVYL